MPLAQPFSAIKETGVTELIGANEQIAQNEYGASVGVDIAVNSTAVSGEILDVIIVQRETDSGAILGEAGELYILDADPEVSAGDTAFAANGTEHQTIIGVVEIAASDWLTDASGGIAYKQVAVAFHAVTDLYFVYKHTGATTVNSGATDDEIFEFNAWYRRDS